MTGAAHEHALCLAALGLVAGDLGLNADALGPPATAQGLIAAAQKPVTAALRLDATALRLSAAHACTVMEGIAGRPGLNSEAFEPCHHAQQDPEPVSALAL